MVNRLGVLRALLVMHPDELYALARNDPDLAPYMGDSADWYETCCWLGAEVQRVADAVLAAREGRGWDVTSP